MVKAFPCSPQLALPETTVELDIFCPTGSILSEFPFMRKLGAMVNSDCAQGSDAIMGPTLDKPRRALYAANPGN